MTAFRCPALHRKSDVHALQPVPLVIHAAQRRQAVPTADGIGIGIRRDGICIGHRPAGPADLAVQALRRHVARRAEEGARGRRREREHPRQPKVADLHEACSAAAWHSGRRPAGPIAANTNSVCRMPRGMSPLRHRNAADLRSVALGSRAIQGKARPEVFGWAVPLVGSAAQAQQHKRTRAARRGSRYAPSHCTLHIVRRAVRHSVPLCMGS